MSGYGEFLTSAVSEASGLAAELAGAVEATVKEDPDQVLTEADLAVGTLLGRAIERAYPRDGLIDEELGVRPGDSGTTWLVDPIDGTANFAAGSPLYAVLVGVLRGGEPVAGAVALPAFGELYVAERGAGVRCNGKVVAPSPRAALSSSLVAYGIDVHDRDRVRTDLRALDSLSASCRGLRMANSAFDLVQVALGVYGGYVHRNCRIWDCVAPQILVEESGGCCTDVYGERLVHDDPASRVQDVYSVVAGAPGVHGELLDRVR